MILLPGCVHLSLWPWKKKKPPRATLITHQLVGTVILVNEESSFVVIDCSPFRGPAVGTVLHGNAGEGTTPAELRVTQIQKPPFAIADIIKGLPKKGGQIFQ